MIHNAHADEIATTCIIRCMAHISESMQGIYSIKQKKIATTKSLVTWANLVQVFPTLIITLTLIASAIAIEYMGYSYQSLY